MRLLKTWRGALWVATIAVILALGGCKSGLDLENDPILRLSADEALETGKQLMEEKKYARAREYLTHAFEVEPNSASGREALLLAADTLFFQGGTDNYIKAEAKYRDFQNRFPTSDRAGYVQFQIANSLAKRMLKPDRDQSATFKAKEAFEEVLLLYPESEYANLAREQIGLVRLTLAESEYLKGHFNHRMGLHEAAIARLARIEDDYPDYAEMDKVVYFLGMAHFKLKQYGQARAYFHRLSAEHAESEFARKIPKVPDVAQEEPAAPEGDEEVETESAEAGSSGR